MKFDDVTKNIPKSVLGNITLSESKYIYEQIIAHGAYECIEIGVASGCSSAVMIAALLENEKPTGKIHTLYSYDLLPNCYWDKSLKVGYAGREMLKSEHHYNWVLRTQTTCLDLKKYHLENSADLIFIDACHDHPWPAIDLYACLPYIKDNGIIILHDINLPTKNPKYKSDGVKTLFYSLDCEKFHINEKIPNIGGIKIKKNKQYLRNQLKRIIKKNKWKIEIEENILHKLKIKNDF